MPPTMLLDSLEVVRRRVKFLSVLYGAGLVIAAAVGLLVLTVLLDYLLNLHAVPRVVVILAALGAIGYALARWVIKPGMARLSLSDVAGRLERAFPQFDDRLRSTVDFLKPGMPGSDVMKQRVVEQASALASNVDLNRAVVAAPAWYAMSGAIATLLIMLLLSVLAGEQFRSIALKHLFMPFADRPWPKRVQIAADGVLPARVPVGQRLDVRMRLVRGDKSSMKPVVCYQYDNGPVEQEFMTRADSGVYAASLDARVDPSKAVGDLKVWMKAGDDRLDLPLVSVVPRLAVKSVEAVVTPPRYVANGTPTTVNLSAAPAVMAVGSEVALHVLFNKALAADGHVAMEPLDAPATTQPSAAMAAAPSAVWSRDGDSIAVGKFAAAAPLRFHLRAVDADGFTNTALEEYELIVRPDQSPSVQLENPRRNEERTAVAAVPLQAVAEDDYGIQTMTLVIDRLERGIATKDGKPDPKASQNNPRHWELPLVDNGSPAADVAWTRVEGTGDRLRFRTTYAWDLSQLKDADLRGGDLLQYYLQVTDNFNLNGQTHAPVASSKLCISIISQDELANRIIGELQLAKNQVAEVKSVQSRTAQETANLADDTKKKDALDQADHAAMDRLTGQQSAAASQTKQIASKVQEIGKRLDENKSPSQELKDLARDVTNDLNAAAEQTMKQATQDLTEAQNAKPAEARVARLDDAKAAQNQSGETLQRVLDRMGDIGSLQQTIARINDLLRQQKDVTNQTQDAAKDNLGKKPDEMKPEDRKKLDAVADAQSKLGDRTAKAIEEMKKAADQLAKADPAASEAMNKAAETARQQQVTPNQQKAAQQAKQNQQASAQSAQKQVELGLQMVIGDLEAAERRKLAQLSRQLEELQQQIANLIRRQSGHNLDNVTVQGPEALAKLDPAVALALNTQAQRDPQQAAPQPDRLAPTLAPSQEQTERNTRDISKSAEALPNGALPASQLLRAAGHMERAIVNLRDSKLPEAYDPAQVEALASLESAKKTVDEQKAKIDDQIAEGQKEAVRQKYVKIKEDQEKLNTETARIDSSRNPQGDLNRVDAVRLGALPGDQGKLSDRVASIDKDLSAVGAVVYVWANKDIAHSMNEVKDDLGKPVTGVSTQAEQIRIVEQLDSMIRNLATKPKESKFAAEGGGGQCKPGTPPLPAEAELRLLKDLQKAINTNTKTVDSQPKKDKPQLLALGTREGELRGLLDQLLSKSSGGQLKLGPEPDNRETLPEEAKVEDVENQELDKNLLNDKPEVDKAEQQTGLIGDRMARSRQRLAMNNDSGKVTQVIQDRILEDFDVLIDQARKQQAELRNPPKDNKPQQKQSKPGDEMAKAENQGKKPAPPKPNPGQNPAQVSQANSPGNANTDLSKEIKESLAEWGQVTPRLREAQIEGSNENIIEQYRKLTEDYYRSLATKASERQ